MNERPYRNNMCTQQGQAASSPFTIKTARGYFLMPWSGLCVCGYLCTLFQSRLHRRVRFKWQWKQEVGHSGEQREMEQEGHKHRPLFQAVALALCLLLSHKLLPASRPFLFSLFAIFCCSALSALRSSAVFCYMQTSIWWWVSTAHKDNSSNVCTK
jgi:hypothetical protein